MGIHVSTHLWVRKSKGERWSEGILLKEQKKLVEESGRVTAVCRLRRDNCLQNQVGNVYTEARAVIKS